MNADRICFSGWSNALFFADEHGSNRWVMVQAGAFINHIVTETADYKIGTGGTGPIDRWLKLIRDGKLDDQWNRNDQFGGFALKASRPFHFFYDQLINVTSLSRNLGGRVPFSTDGSEFWNVDGFSGQKPLSIETGKYYLLPSVLYSFSWKRSRSEEFYSAASTMEAQLKTQALQDQFIQA